MGFSYYYIIYDWRCLTLGLELRIYDVSHCPIIISPPAGSGHGEDMDVISATFLEKAGCGVPWQCWI